MPAFRKFAAYLYRGAGKTCEPTFYKL